MAKDKAQSKHDDSDLLGHKKPKPRNNNDTLKSDPKPERHKRPESQSDLF